MVELGELEAHHDEFDRRNARIVAVSIEGPEKAAKTQAEYPHLLVLADQARSLAGAAELLHRRSAPDGDDTAAPTVILIDRTGTVRWLFRPEKHIVRLTAAEKLAAVDEHLRQQP
jgi:peroxiredoxin